MSTIYLSPSVEESNEYVKGGNEEYYMNLIVDAMVPYLRANKIDFTRNSPGFNLSDIIAQSNTGIYDLHLALHSNFSPENLTGILQGPDVYHYAYSEKGKKAADIIASNLKINYPNPDLVTVIPNTTLNELKKVKAPAVLVELAYHDNADDAQWIRDNINGIARILVASLAQYFGISFVDPYSTASY